MKKNAQDLNLNDLFFHNELYHWQVIEQPTLTNGTTIKVIAKYSKTGKVKTFNFGCFVSLDLR